MSTAGGHRRAPCRAHRTKSISAPQCLADQMLSSTSERPTTTNKRKRAEARRYLSRTSKAGMSSIHILLCQLALQHAAGGPTFVSAFADAGASARWTSTPAHTGISPTTKRMIELCQRCNEMSSGRIPTYCSNSASSEEESTCKRSSATATAHHASDTLLLDILSPSSDRKNDRIGTTQLAFVGDIVYELFVRCRYVWPARRTTDLQSIVVNTVRAESQSKLLASMMKSFPFTDKELSVLTRGRNASSGSRGRKRGKEWGAIYQDSTAFEALIGYVYLEDINRCFELLDWIRIEQDSVDEKEGTLPPQTSKNGGSPQYNSFLDLLRPRSDCDVDRIAPAQLAYVGDSVYEMLVRNRYVWPTRRTADLHTKVVSVSRAETQAMICRSLTDENNESALKLKLTAKESSVLLRGRNAAGGSGGRNKQVKKAGRAQQVDASMHQDAAALECLLAYNFIADPGRCHELLQWVSAELDVVDAGQ